MNHMVEPEIGPTDPTIVRLVRHFPYEYRTSFDDENVPSFVSGTHRNRPPTRTRDINGSKCRAQPLLVQASPQQAVPEVILMMQALGMHKGHSVIAGDGRPP